MSVLNFKQPSSGRIEKRVRENKAHAKQAVARKRQRDALGIKGLSATHVTQADIDRVPEDATPMYSNQFLGKLLTTKWRPRRRWFGLFRRNA